VALESSIQLRKRSVSPTFSTMMVLRWVLTQSASLSTEVRVVLTSTQVPTSASFASSGLVSSVTNSEHDVNPNMAAIYTANWFCIIQQPSDMGCSGTYFYWAAASSGTASQSEWRLKFARIHTTSPESSISIFTFTAKS